MIMVHLVTGFAGENHITSADDGALNWFFVKLVDKHGLI